ncbi:MAG: sigma-54-dependent Fis family transcriptional regulator [Desulfobacteraceae bacterium]|nr:sigma-54-dependent Fis family transcriptional regulator [Desulfobacteraceae bacterium]
MKAPKVLIAGKRCQLWERVNRLITSIGFRTFHVGNHHQAETMIHQHRPSMAFCISSNRSTSEGLRMLTSIRKTSESLPTILVTAHSSEAIAIAALRAGADDYFKKPFTDRELLSSCRRVMQIKILDGVDTSICDLSPENAAGRMVGESPSMCEVKSYIAKVAKSDSTVLITGETGTGKELAAELVHHHSIRSNRPMVSINCAALPENLVESELFGYERGAFTGAAEKRLGKFALANESTILLDEIGDMTPHIQAKILHAIEQKVVYPLGCNRGTPLDVRVVAATNREPEELISENRFRSDLYYRLNIARIRLPALRERKEDIPALVKHGIAKLNQRFHKQVKGLSPEALESLGSYDWPGNVRELLNILESTFISQPGDHITYADLPAYFRNNLAIMEGPTATERRAIISALTQTNWNKSRAAQKLNWSRMTLYRKMTQFKITEIQQSNRSHLPRSQAKSVTL